MPGIAVVTNPRSRQNRRNPRIAGQLSYLLGERGEVAQPSTLSELVETAKKYRDREIDVLAINGGDGTAHVVLTAFARAYGGAPLPPVALLRGGTMNTVASGLGIRGKPATLLSSLVDRYHRQEPFALVERSLLKVDGEEPQFGFLFGNGIVSNFLEAYYEGSEPSPLKAASVLTRAVASTLVGGALSARLMRPTRVAMKTDTGAWPMQDYLTVTAGTVDDMGLRFRPFMEAPRHPGYMQVLGIACRPVDVLWQLVRMRLGLLPNHPDISSSLTRRIELQSDQPISYMIDGDFHVGGTSLRLETGPTVRLVLPEEEG